MTSAVYILINIHRQAGVQKAGSLPTHRRLDAFADWRLIVTGDDASEMAVLGPLRAGVAFRF
jgi:hypothetical protein